MLYHDVNAGIFQPHGAVVSSVAMVRCTQVPSLHSQPSHLHCHSGSCPRRNRGHRTDLLKGAETQESVRDILVELLTFLMVAIGPRKTINLRNVRPCISLNLSDVSWIPQTLAAFVRCPRECHGRDGPFSQHPRGQKAVTSDFVPEAKD